MKRILSLAVLLSFSSALGAFAAQPLEAAAWSGVQTYDLRALEKIQSSQVGKIVGVRINYRNARISHPKPSWYESSIWSYRPGEKEKKDKFAFLRVMVAKKDLPAFKSIPTDFQSPGEIIVYGQVQRDTRANFLFIRLLGRKANIDPAGNATIDW